MSRFASIIVVAVAALFLTSCADEEKAKDKKSGGGDAKVEKYDLPYKSDPKNPVVVMETNMGTVKIELFENQAPISVKNFLSYVDRKHYDDTIFHRVKPDFMIQGGGFGKDTKEKGAGAPIKNESYNNLSNKRGTLAMARTPVPDSATDQFFINVSHKNSFLDKVRNQDGFGYAVFGMVTEGMDVVDRIRYVETHDSILSSKNINGLYNKSLHSDVPITAVVIRSIRRVK